MNFLVKFITELTRSTNMFVDLVTLPGGPEQVGTSTRWGCLPAGDIQGRNVGTSSIFGFEPSAGV